MIGRRIAIALALAAGVASTIWPGGAWADVNYELVPSLALGVTSNAQNQVFGTPDEFLSMSALGQVRQRGARETASLGYRLSLAHYFQGRGTDTVSNELLALSSFTLTSATELHLTATAVLSRTSQVGTLGLVAPQANATGSALFLSTGAGEELGWTGLRWRLSQQLGASTLLYPGSDPAPNRRTVTVLTAGARADYTWPVDSLSLQLQVSEFLAEAAPASGMLAAVPALQAPLGQALLGWRHDLSVTFSFELQGGLAYYSNGAGADVLAPAGHAVVAYRLRTWFATIEAAQQPSVNMMTALASLNDEVFARLALPVDQRELIVVSGYAGFIYARTADANANLVRAYDQETVGGLVSVQFGHLPLAGSLEYNFVDQHGGPGVLISVPDLKRHVFMLHLTAALEFGPGTPPLSEAGRLMMPEAR